MSTALNSEEILERESLDELWRRFSTFRMLPIPHPEARGQLPILPRQSIFAEGLKEYLNKFLANVLNPALGQESHCLFLNLCIWDPFRNDSPDNWAFTSAGINRVGKEFDLYLESVSTAFYFLYKILKKDILIIKLVAGEEPSYDRTNTQMLYQAEGGEMHYQGAEEYSARQISDELDRIVKAHEVLSPKGRTATSKTLRYVYYIPSLFYPKGSGTGIGGLILISKHSFTSETLLRFQTVLDSILSKIGVFYLFENFFDTSVRSAISSIMARNMSHNIGSHVIPRATVDAVKRRLESLKLWPGRHESGLKLISALKGNLDEYTQRKSDFLAEITTEPLMATRPAFLYREVILPFVENTLLTDNIAANEGVRFYGGGKSNRLKIKVFINGKELKAIYKCDSCDPSSAIGDYSYPESLPYSLCCSEHKNTRLRIANIENGDEDVEVELPGPLGEFALYSFLENYIRNVVKHNKERLTSVKDVLICLGIYDFDSDYYQIKIWNNVIDPKGSVNLTVDGKKHESLANALSEHINSRIIQPDGSLKRQAWGIGEMKICSVLLRGPKDFVTSMEDKNLWVKTERDIDKVERLVYGFYLMKSKRVCAVLPWLERVAERRNKEEELVTQNEGWNGSLLTADKAYLRKNGIWIFSTLEELQNELNRGESIASFRFALFDCSGTAGKERAKILAALRSSASDNKFGILPKFPFRVLVLAGNHSLSLPKCIRLIEHETGASDNVIGRTPKELVSFLWCNWLGRWLSAADNRTAIVNLFLDQRDGEQPTENWRHHAKLFNKSSAELKVCVYATEPSGSVKNLCNVTRRSKDYAIIYDRHRGLRDELQEYLRTSEKWSYMLLEKHSPDFTNLFSPKFPTNKEEYWTLPWELAEAGLLRILVIDERAAEFSMDTLGGDPEEIIFGLLQELSHGKLPANLLARKWHLAWAAKVFICTHFGIEQEPVPLHERISECEESAPYLKMNVCKQGPIFELSLTGKKNRTLDADAVLIHQGILDEWLTKRGLDQNKFLDELRLQFPFVIVESGRGIPPNLSDGEKFLPFSLLQHTVLGENIGKFGLTRILMSLARRRGRSEV